MASFVTIGGKGSTLDASSLYAVTNGIVQVRIDSSVFEKISSSSKQTVSSIQAIRISPNDLEELRAALLVSLNMLVVSCPSGVTAGFLNDIADALNQGLKDRCVELCVLPNSALIGMFAILDCKAFVFPLLADFAAALACEALKADVSSFNNVDFSVGLMDEISVAGDLKVLLNGSKCIGEFVNESVMAIPSLHGSLRLAVKSIHDRARVELNSGIRVGSAMAVAADVIRLTKLLQVLGESSLSRANFMSGSSAVFCDLRGRLEANVPSFRKAVDLITKVSFGDDDLTLMRHALALFNSVWDIVALEAMLAFSLLEGDSLGKNQTDEGVGDFSNAKKKKVVLGKGNTVIVQHIKETLRFEQTDIPGAISALFNPRNPEFNTLLTKIKETLESNGIRRLPKLPKGTRDFSNEQMAVREKVFAITTSVFKRHGATVLDTPLFELREILMGRYGEDSKLIFDLADQGGEHCSLRYDLTVPFARHVAMNGLTSFKRCQIGKVYRRDNPSKGRFREFYQCDMDIAGQFELMGPDFEIVKILTELLDELDIGDYEIKLSHRKLLDGLMEICGVPPPKFKIICSSIDKLDKLSFEQIKKEMVEEKGLTADTADKIGEYVKQQGSPLKLLYKLKQDGSQLLQNQKIVVALNELEILFKALEKSKCIDKVVFDLSLARGLDYYTGVIFEAVFKGSTQVGSIAAGGRYDNLIGELGTKKVPSVGLSLGIERVLAIMEDAQQNGNQLPVRATETQVLVSIVGDDLCEAAELSSQLWSAKIKTEFLVHKRKSKHLDYLKASRIPWSVTVGEKEITEGTVKMTNNETKEEFKDIPRESFVEKLQQLMIKTANNTRQD